MEKSCCRSNIRAGRPARARLIHEIAFVQPHPTWLWKRRLEQQGIIEFNPSKTRTTMIMCLYLVSLAIATQVPNALEDAAQEVLTSHSSRSSVNLHKLEPRLAKGDVCFQLCEDKSCEFRDKRDQCAVGYSCQQQTGVKGLKLSSWSISEQMSFTQTWTCEPKNKPEKKATAPIPANSLRGRTIATSRQRRLLKTSSVRV